MNSHPPVPHLGAAAAVHTAFPCFSAPVAYGSSSRTMRTYRHGSRVIPSVACSAIVCLMAILVTAGPAVSAAAGSPSDPQSVPSSRHLSLGPADLAETRTTTSVQPGVTLTRITRGTTDPSLVWTLESLIPSTSTSPDPDAPPRVLSDRVSTQAQADRIRSKGFDARAEPVYQPAVADVPAGVLGYRVRVGRYPSKHAADQ